MLSLFKDLFKFEDRPQPRFEPAPEAAPAIKPQSSREALAEALAVARADYRERVKAATAALEAATPAGRVREAPEGGFIIERSKVHDGEWGALRMRYPALYISRSYQDEQDREEIERLKTKEPNPLVEWTSYQKRVGTVPTASASASRWGYSDASVSSSPIFEPVIFQTKAKAQRALKIWLSPEDYTAYSDTPEKADV